MVFNWLFGPHGPLFGMPGPAGRGAGYPAGFFNGGWADYNWMHPDDFLVCGFEGPLPEDAVLSPLSLAVREALAERLVGHADEIYPDGAFCRALWNPCVYVDDGEAKTFDLLCGFQHANANPPALLIGTTDHDPTVGVTYFGKRGLRKPIRPLRNPPNPAAAADYARAAFDRWCEHMSRAPANA